MEQKNDPISHTKSLSESSKSKGKKTSLKTNAKRSEKTKALQDRWIAEYIRNGMNASAACKHVGISGKGMHYWRNNHPDFVIKLQEAIHARNEVGGALDGDLIEKALRRVKNAVDDPLDADSAFKILEALVPEVWDPRIRAKVWEKKQGVKPLEQQRQAIFIRGEDRASVKRKLEEEQEQQNATKQPDSN